MPFYMRKSVKVGPFRFNLSKSGVGVSAGVKGFRVGTGPRGNYVHMGRGGLYYRATLPSGKPQSAKGPVRSNNLGFEDTQPLEILPDTHEPLREIDSGEIGAMVDTSSKSLVDELNSKRKQFRLWPFVGAASLVVFFAFALAKVPIWVNWTILGVGAALTLVAFYRDLISKTAVILYDIEDDYLMVMEDLHSAFDKMKGCRAIWHLQAEGRVKDRKYHAGASHLVKRNGVSLSVKSPPFVKTNVATPSIPVGNQTLYFFPDKVLVYESNGVGAVSYENLKLDISPTQFIEEGGVPKDAKVVDHTWKYVNKRGGPDKRFKDNRQIPLCLYEDVHFSSNTGLNERIELSRTGSASEFVAAITKVGRASAAYG